MTPRIPPTQDPGLVNGLILRALGLATGGRPLNVFTTLARHRSLFRRWLLFAGGLMPGGTLPRADAELVILRVAHNCASEYERSQHERIAALAGLTQAEIDATAGDVSVLSERQRLLTRTCDALHADRDVDDALWAQIRTELGETRGLELFLLIGHYEMLAMTLNAARVEPDAPSGPPSAAMRAAQRLLRRD